MTTYSERQLDTETARNPEDNLTEYWLWVNRRWDSDPRSEREKIWCAALGLCGEAGEVIEPIKKGLVLGKPISRSCLVKELGDVLHYWSRIAGHFGITPNEVMQANIVKIEGRMPVGYPPISATDEIQVIE